MYQAYYFCKKYVLRFLPDLLITLTGITRA